MKNPNFKYISICRDCACKIHKTQRFPDGCTSILVSGDVYYGEYESTANWSIKSVEFYNEPPEFAERPLYCKLCLHRTYYYEFDSLKLIAKQPTN